MGGRRLFVTGEKGPETKTTSTRCLWGASRYLSWPGPVPVTVLLRDSFAVTTVVLPSNKNLRRTTPSADRVTCHCVSTGALFLETSGRETEGTGGVSVPSQRRSLRRAMLHGYRGIRVKTLVSSSLPVPSRVFGSILEGSLGLSTRNRWE